jgi:flavin reductase (DIM6/NTAB) family NADH-FMN oxidoreductase RutF
MIFDASQISSQEKYRLLSGGVSPRPIAWISTRSAAGDDNLAPYSFFTVASCEPPVLLFTQVLPRTLSHKDTLQNLIETNECVVNVVSRDLLEKMNKTSATLPSKESEYTFANVESCASEKVSPRSVKNSPIRYECTLRDTHCLGQTATAGTVILLDVKSIYVADALIDDGIVNQQLLDSVGKMGGDFFSFTSDMITLKRP